MVLWDIDSDLLSTLMRGFRLSTDGGEKNEHAVPVAVEGPEGVYDAVFLAAAAPDVDPLLRALSPHVHRSTFYLDLSGNLGYEHVGEMVGEERVLVGVPGWAAEWQGKRSVGLVGRSLCVGEASGPASERACQAARAISATALGPARVSDDCVDELWASLCYTLPLDSLGAILGLGFDRLVEQAGVPDIVLKAAGEVREVARALGYRLDAPDDWAALKESENGGRGERAVENFFAHARELPASRVKSALLDDIEAGRRSDNIHLAALVTEKARGLTVATPVCNALSTLLRELERGAREPSPANLRELARRIGEEDGMLLR